MDLENVTDWLPRKTVLFGFLLGLAAPTVLAAVYVISGGPSIAGKEGFAIVDSMLFASVTLTASIIGGGTFLYFTRDISTSLAPVIGVVVGLYSGFEDYMVYFFCTFWNQGNCSEVNGLPGQWSWLEDSMYIGDIQSVLQFNTVTDLSIALAIILAVVLGLFFVKISDKTDFEVLGIPV